MPDTLIRLTQKPTEIAPYPEDLVFLDGTRGVRGITWSQLLALLVQDLTSSIGTDVASLSAIQDAAILLAFVSAGYSRITSTLDSDGLVSSATVKWPDQSAGVYTRIVKNADFLEADSWSVTHAVTGRTYTQPTVTRDANGRITDQPAVVIT